MHEYYHSEGVTDLEAIRKDARYRVTDRIHPESSIIHLHPKTGSCDAFQHEALYVAGIEPSIPHDEDGLAIDYVVHTSTDSCMLTWGPAAKTNVISQGNGNA